MKEKKIQNWYALFGLILIFAVLILGTTHKLGLW